jgi:4-aminobutyrate aminotransferase
MALRYTGGSDVITLFGSHHGQTLFTTSVSGQAFRRKALPAAWSPLALRAPAPNCRRCAYKQTFPDCGLLCATRIGDIIDAAGSDPACMIVEPVLANGGNIVPPPGYFPALRRLCDERGIVLIADEVQTGLGRTGHMFASEALGLRPDIVTVGKGLGGLGLPIGAILMRSELDVLEAHDHSFTSGGWLVALKAAVATIDVIGAPGFLERVRQAGVLLGRLLGELVAMYPCVADARGVGLMWGIEVADAHGAPDPELTREIVDRAYQCGLIVRSSAYGRGNVVKVRPSLIITDGELHALVDRLADAIGDAIG